MQVNLKKKMMQTSTNNALSLDDLDGEVSHMKNSMAGILQCTTLVFVRES